MKIWRLEFEVDEYDNLATEKDMSLDEMQSFDGRSQKADWRPLKVIRMEPEKNLELSNAPGFIFPVFDKKALEILLPLIENEVEILPLEFDEREFYGINVTKVMDCIDYDNSKFKLFSDGKRIMRFIKYSFVEEKIKGMNIFKIIDEPRRRAFVSDEFRNAVLNTGLTGFKFKLVWDSEQ